MRSIRLTRNWRHLRAGTALHGTITSDDMNFYVHGVNDEPVPGVFANYLTVPRYAAREEV